jgi:hypothetical protein
MRCFLARSLYGFCVLLWGLIALNSIAKAAYAYVDPGSGLLLIQIIGSTFAGMTFLLRKHIRQFFARFGKNPEEADREVGQR